MTRFYLHIHNGIGLSEDEEGCECPDLEAARNEAIRGIRSLLAAELIEGSIDLCGRIEVADEAGRIVAVVPFRDAVELHLDTERSSSAGTG